MLNDLGAAGGGTALRLGAALGAHLIVKVQDLANGAKIWEQRMY